MKRISLRLPDEIHAALVKSAAWNNRSLHAELLSRLEPQDTTMWSTPNGVGGSVGTGGFTITGVGIKTDFKKAS